MEGVQLMSAEETYLIQVNGVEIKVETDKDKAVTAGDILEAAKREGAIPGNPEDYILKGENREYAWDETVNVADDKDFIAIPNTPTPVA